MSDTRENVSLTVFVGVSHPSLRTSFILKKGCLTMMTEKNGVKVLKLQQPGLLSLMQFVSIWTWVLLRVWFWGIKEQFTFKEEFYIDG